MLTIKARADGVPLVQRWRELEFAACENGSRRAEFAASLLTDAESVADLGCGHMTLERCLRLDQIYIPMDLVPRDQRTIVVDFNAEPIPAIEATHFAALGLLEYIYRLPDFVAELRSRFAAGVISFAVRPADAVERGRLASGWVNHQTDLEIRTLIVESGFAIRQIIKHAPRQVLYQVA